MSVPEDAYMVKLLRQSGLVLRPSPPHALTCELKPFLKKLTNEFQLDITYPSRAKKFSKEFLKFLESSPAALSSCLAPLAWDCDEATSDYRRESLIRALVQIPDLQMELLVWLTEKMVLTAIEEEDGTAEETPAGTLPKSRLILSQIRWLNKIADGKMLSDKVVEILESSPWGLQLDLIPALPDIVEDKFHCRMAMILRDLMKDNVDLIGACLDAFSCLSIGDDVMDEIRRSILKGVSNTAKEDLPAVVKFLLDSCPEGEEEVMACDLRESIDFSSSQLMTQLTQKRRKVRKDENKDVDVILIHLIEDVVACNRKAATAWFKAVEQVNTARGLKPFDVLVLLILHTIPNRKKNVESLFKNKIRSGALSEQLVQSTFSNHPNVAKKFLESIMALTTTFSLSPEPVLNHQSLVWRREAFLHLDRACKQEIFADLVYKISSYGYAPTRTTALKTLVHLTQNHTEETLRYGSFVESILDYVSCLDLSEFRQVMDVLSLLAYSTKDAGCTLQDNIHMVIRKQVGSKNVKLVRMGVTGAVVTIKNMTSRRGADETLTSVPATQMAGPSSGGGGSPKSTSSNLENAANLLRRVLDKSMASGEIAGLLMDELSNVMERKGLDERLQSFINRKMTGTFQEDYVMDLNEDGQIKDIDESSLEIPVKVEYNLDPDSEIAINLAPMLGGRENKKKSKDKAEMLLPEFRLLKTSVAVTTSNHGSLDDIDALLGCPIVLPADVNLEKFEVLSVQEKNVVCASLFYCANWFREILNAFGDQQAEDCRNRVLVRLKHLLRVLKDLRNCLEEHQSFVPPSVIHIADVSSWKPLSEKGSKGGGGKGKGGGKKRKAAGNDDVTVKTQTQITKNQTGVEDGQKDLSFLDYYQPFFRELDLKTFAILSYDTVTIASEPTEEEEKADPKLRPPELSYLLNDLHSKLAHVLVSYKGKKTSPFENSRINLKGIAFSRLDEEPPAEVAKFAIGLLDYLLADLEEIAGYHKRMLEANDGVLDSPGMFNEHTAAVCACQERIFACLSVFLSWNGFQSKEHAPMLKDALATVGRRFNAKVSAARSTSAELGDAAFSHLARCSDTVLHAGGAAAHLNLLSSLLQFVGEERRCVKGLAEAAKTYLSRDWRDFYGDKDKGSR